MYLEILKLILSQDCMVSSVFKNNLVKKFLVEKKTLLPTLTHV